MRALFGSRKRLFTICTSILALAIFAFVSSRVSDPILATSDGSAYTVPLVDDINPDPDIVETTIVAQPAGVDVGTGSDASVLTFNGSIPGPEFRLKVGDTVIVHFRNEIAHATGIHWHGIELNNASDGTPLTQNMVEPGDTYLYKFKVLRPGVFWYHPHHHSSTNQVFKGMYGSMIVTDPDEESLVGTVLPSAADTHTMVFSDLTVCKAPGSNDAQTYPGTLPHVSGGALPIQTNPKPVDICEGSPLDEDGVPRPPYAAGDVPNIQKDGTGGRVNEGQTVLTNGINVGHRDGSPSAPGPVAAGANMLDVTAGQGIRLQMINAATIRFFRLILTDASGTQVPLVRVGGQGGVLDHARQEGNVQPVPAGTFDFKYTKGEILLDPGDRQDVVVTIPASATPGQVLTMWTQDFQRVGQGAGWADIPTVPVAHFNVVGTGGTYSLTEGTALRASIGGANVEVLGLATTTLLDPTAFTPPKIGLPPPNEEIHLIATGSSLQVDGHVGSHDFTGDYTEIDHQPSQRYAASLGDTLELKVTNTSNSHHPFHLHGFSIQPLDFTKAGSPTYTFGYADYRDNIDVPKGYTLRFRVRLDDRPLMDGTTMGGGLGRWVFHCHIFFHAVFGMISEFDVVAADGNEKPNINADDTVIEGAASDTLTMHGTYHDEDGDPITLSASAGTITDDGDGIHWTWEQTGASSGLVYVTATDDNGLANQTAFQLKINGPPVLVVPGPQVGVYSDALSFGISATDPDNDPIVLTASGLPASLAIVDHGNGTATISGNLTVIPAVYVATFFANDGHNAPVSATVEITVTKETTTLEYIGPTVILGGGASATLSGRLLEDDGPPVVGRTVDFTLGAQACSGVTNGSGVASCSVPVNSALGPQTVTSDFAGDAFYLPSADSDSVIVFAFPSNGAFVIGDSSAGSGGSKTWWGAQWANVNALSGGAAPSAFKGFAEDPTLPSSSPPPTCAVPWTSSPGNSGQPPSTVPSYMGVLVASGVTKNGSTLTGTITKIVVVQPNAGYGPNPGHAGTGPIVAVFCQ